MLSAISDQLQQLGIVGAAAAKPELRNRGVQTPGPPAFPKVRKFTPKERSAASEAQSRAAKQANRSKAWLESRFCAARAEFEDVLARKFGMTSGPTERLADDAKVHVALSACLNGEAVRHNAGHCFAPFIVDDMGEFLTFESVCPEVEGLGLGTPRETIRLVNASGDLEDWGNTTLLGTKSGNNYTSMMAAYTASKFEALDNAGTNGYILKALSPSCGLRGIPVYPTVGTKGRGSGKAQAGMFAKALMELWPELPVEDEGRLADVSLRHSFYTRVEAHRRWRRALQQRAAARGAGQPYRPLLAFHNTHLLLADAHDATSVRALEALAEEASRRESQRSGAAAVGADGVGVGVRERSASDQSCSTADEPSSAADTITTSQSDLDTADTGSDSGSGTGDADSDGVRADEEELYHRYYHTFFMALKRTGGRASTARCLRHCLAVLEGKDDKKEAAAENESETAAEGEARREQDLDNGSMLGMFLEYDDDDDGEVAKEGDGAVEVEAADVVEHAKVCAATSTAEKPAAHARPETATATTPFVRRVCVIDADDAAEIAESIEDFYNALVPLSMPLGCIGRQLKRLARDRAKHEATAEQLGCDMGEHRGARALDLLEKQAFLQPHKCKRVLSTIRQNKFGQAFAASHAFTCL